MQPRRKRLTPRVSVSPSVKRGAQNCPTCWEDAATTAARHVCWFPAHTLDPAPGTRSAMSSGGRTGPPESVDSPDAGWHPAGAQETLPLTPFCSHRPQVLPREIGSSLRKEHVPETPNKTAAGLGETSTLYCFRIRASGLGCVRGPRRRPRLLWASLCCLKTKGSVSSAVQAGPQCLASKTW